MSNFNIFGDLNERPIESLGEVIEAPYKDEVVPTEQSVEGASVETFNPYDMQERMHLKSMLLSDKGYGNCIDACGGPRKKPVTYIKTKCSIDGSQYWEFFMPDVTFTVLNDFVSKLSTVKPEESIMLHGPANCCVDDALVIISAIKRCVAKKVYISSPYILDIPAAAILCAGDVIINSVCGLMRLETPRVGAGGAVQDAKASFDNSLNNVSMLLKTLKDNGFVTDDECKYMINDQGSVCIHGKKLAEIVDVFNQKHA